LRNINKTIFTWPPPKTNEPSLLRSFKGIHDASRALNAGNVVPSPKPSRNRNAIRASGPPHFIAAGVNNVNIAVDKIPKLNVYFPPNLSANSPPGKCVITYPQKNDDKIIP